MTEHPTLKWFKWEHLKPEQQGVSKQFGLLAKALDNSLEDGPEKSVALRKLLESKDAAVRANIIPGG
ncbi:MAG: hypothetical protein KDA71_07705 [Planctomycetales bacterium]|nr:hypothetical protein [Planctomycetales bacterium]